MEITALSGSDFDGIQQPLNMAAPPRKLTMAMRTFSAVSTLSRYRAKVATPVRHETISPRSIPVITPLCRFDRSSAAMAASAIRDMMGPITSQRRTRSAIGTGSGLTAEGVDASEGRCFNSSVIWCHFLVGQVALGVSAYVDGKSFSHCPQESLVHHPPNRGDIF